MPMVLRITLFTFRDLIRSRYLVFLLLFPIVTFVVTAVLYTTFAWYFEEQPPIFWDLEQYWKKSFNEHVSWVEEIGKVNLPQFYANRDPYEDRTQYIFSHIKLLTDINTKVVFIVLPFLVILITSRYLNRLFYSGELTLYLIRPLDVFSLFWGRFFGLFLFFLLMTLMSDLVMIVGGLSENWRLAASFLLILLQTKVAVIFGLIALPFFFSPLVGNLFSGAGNIVFSGGTAVITFLLRSETSLHQFLLSPLTVYQSLENATILHRLLRVFSTVFLMPLPKIFNARGFIELLSDIQPYNFLYWSEKDLPEVIFEQAYFWWWSFGSGLVILLLAMIIWWRNETA